MNAYIPRYLSGLGEMPPNPEVNLPSLGLLPDIVFEPFYQVLERWDCYKKSAALSPALFTSKLSWQRPLSRKPEARKTSQLSLQGGGVA